MNASLGQIKDKLEPGIINVIILRQALLLVKHFNSKNCGTFFYQWSQWCQWSQWSQWCSVWDQSYLYILKI